jgi:hypothetical protein
MVKHAAVKILIVMFALGLCLPAAGALAQDGDTRYIDATGHNIGGAFLAFYDAHGGADIFGYPITEAFEHSDDGVLMQYFQRARFEWDAAAGEVTLGKLGLALHDPAPPRPPSAFSSAERYFESTGQAVGWEFLAFYEAHGGETVFGAPITGLLVEDGRTVQYFERARFEWWYPETPARPVRLMDIGTVAFLRSGLDPDLLRSTPVPSGHVRVILEVEVRASVASPVLGEGETQTVFVRVTDQVREALAGAQVRLVCRVDGEPVLDADLPPTDTGGLTALELALDGVPPGAMVVVDVTAAYDDLTAVTQTSFRVWW